MNIGIAIGHHARRHPGQLAVQEDGGRSLTYAGLETRSNRLAHYLTEVARRPAGDRVGYLLYNRLKVIELLVACAKLGAIAAPMNFRLTETNLRAIFGNAGVRLVVIQPEFAELVHSLAAELDFGVLLTEEEYEGAQALAPPRRPRQCWLLTAQRTRLSSTPAGPPAGRRARRSPTTRYSITPLTWRSSMRSIPPAAS